MRHTRHTLCLLSVLLMAIAMGACSGEDCPINNTVQGKMTFVSHLGDPVAIANATLSVSVVRPQGDSVILNKKQKAADVTFPLSYTHETDTFIFCYNLDGEVIYDSLYIGHTNTPTLVSIDCGTAMFHHITSASSTQYLIDTLILKSSEVNYDERENIQVVYRTAD